MCLILHKPAGVEVEEEKLFNAWSNNKDGLGIMFKGHNNRIYTHKLMPQSFTDVMKVWNRHKHNDLAIHFRFATSGEKNKKMAHPFQILSHAKDGIDLYMMHNGVLAKTPITNTKASDTWHFISSYLKPFLKSQGLSAIKDEFFQRMLADFIGTGNKFLFLDGNGQWTIINRKAGSDTIIPDCWASNEYSIKTSTWRNPPKIVPNSMSYDSYDNYNNYYNNYSYDASAWNTFLPADEKNDYTKLLNHVKNKAKKNFTSNIGINWLWKCTETKKILEPHMLGDQNLADFQEMDYDGILTWVLENPEEATVLLDELLQEVISNKKEGQSS